jgi:hypothetical protein
LEPLWESRLGRIIGTDGEGRPVVDFEGNPVGPRVARKAVRLDTEGLQAAVETRQPVELRFEDGDPQHPIIMALLPVAPRDAQRNALQAALEEAAESRARVIQGQDGLVLHCGEASVTLLRNGRVSLKGSSVETTAEGTLRLKGMSVQVRTPGAQAASAYEEEARPREAGGLPLGEDAADVQLIQSQKSLTLRCGRASLTLLRSGRILLEGTYVETCAEGVIRLQGGSVRIN